MIVTHPNPTQAMPTYQQPAYGSYQQPSSKPQYLGGQQQSSSSRLKPPLPYAGAPPPVPAGMSVNPQQWQAGYWHYNPSWNQNQNSKQHHVPWIPSHHWMPQHNQQSSSSASQQQSSHNPYKRVPRPPSAEYLATQLSDNPLGLSGLDEPNKYYDHAQTPWVWRPRDLVEDDQESPSQEHTSNDPLNHSRKDSENINTENPVSFTAKRELQPTFSVNIVRTPEHYRRQSSGSNPSTPSRNSSRESRANSSDGPSPWNSMMSPGNNGINGGPRDSVVSSPDSSFLSASGPILGDQLSDEPTSMLSPLIISHTPKTGSSPLRSLRSHVTHPLIGSSLEPIPEAMNVQNDSKLTPMDRRPAPVTHSSSLPTLTSKGYNGLHPSPQREGYEKERDKRDREKKDRSGIGSKYTTATFIESRSVALNTYNHNHPPSPASPSSQSTPSSRHSSSSLPSPTYTSSHPTPPSSYSPRPSPPQRRSKNSPPEDVQYKPQLQAQPSPPSFTKPSKSSESSTLVFSKIPLPPPPSLQGNYVPIRPPSLQTYDNRRRRGYWNRRGDHLTDSGFIVHAPPHKLFPHELRNYPAEDEGYENHDGIFTAFIPRPDLPESIPKNGKPAEIPYEHFVVYQSR